MGAGPKITKDEIVFARKLRKEDRSWREIGEKTGRSSQGISAAVARDDELRAEKRAARKATRAATKNRIREAASVKKPPEVQPDRPGEIVVTLYGKEIVRRRMAARQAVDWIEQLRKARTPRSLIAE
jgi:IS30 family transposase